MCGRNDDNNRRGGRGGRRAKRANCHQAGARGPRGREDAGKATLGAIVLTPSRLGPRHNKCMVRLTWRDSAYLHGVRPLARGTIGRPPRKPAKGPDREFSHQ